MNDGGPAFPTPTTASTRRPDGEVTSVLEFNTVAGITLLDYFAGKALVGILANPNFHWDLSKAYTPEEAVVERAFEVAKAAVAYRSKPNA